MRVTYSLVAVGSALMADQWAQHWAYDLSLRSGVRPGTLYPMVNRMIDEGWLQAGWENGTAESLGRPPRRWLTLTDRGRSELGAVLSAARRSKRFGRPRPGWST